MAAKLISNATIVEAPRVPLRLDRGTRIRLIGTRIRLVDGYSATSNIDGAGRIVLVESRRVGRC
jgi:hypothetical protein